MHTDLCEHTRAQSCIHCEEGCRSCGKLIELDDDSYCDDCAFEQACLKSDILFEQLKEGD